MSKKLRLTKRMNYSLGLLGVLLLVDFMTLNVIMYVYTDVRPGFGYSHADQDLAGVVVLVLLATVCVVTWFYFVYFAAIVLNIRVIH